MPRTSRALIGRSTEPRRGRARGAQGLVWAAPSPGQCREQRGRRSTTLASPCPTAATILLVDDEESVQKLLTYPLEREGYRVVQARDGEEALERFAAEQVDLVVLDLMLPRVDGLEVCRRLRAESTVPIIMLTARDDEVDKVLGLELGADDYITKPFSIREFRSRVRALLRRPRPRRRSRGDETIEADGLRIDCRAARSRPAASPSS